MAASALVSKSPAERTFQIVEGPNAGQTCRQTIEAVTDGWRLTLEGFDIVQLSLHEDGTLLTIQEEDITSRVRVHYDPPLPILPARLAVGHSLEGESRVEIRNLSDGSVRTKGVCKYHIELFGRQWINTPAGRFDAYVVQANRQMALDMATVDVTLLNAYVPGKGQIAQTLAKKVLVMGLFPTQSEREIRVASFRGR